MKVAKLESLHCDAGTRNFDFLKLTTDTGLVGWAEYNETFGGPGLAAVIDKLAPSVMGKDPRAWEAHVTLMYAIRRQASGGLVQQAIAAIENAMLDVKARALEGEDTAGVVRRTEERRVDAAGGISVGGRRRHERQRACRECEAFQGHAAPPGSSASLICMNTTPGIDAARFDGHTHCPGVPGSPPTPSWATGWGALMTRPVP